MRHRALGSHVAKYNEEHCGANVKMIRYYIWDIAVVVLFGYAFYGLCQHTHEPEDCGLPQEYDVMQVCLGNNRKILVNSVFMVLLRVKM